MKMTKLLVSALVAFSMAVPPSFAMAEGKQVFGYYTNWDTYGRNYQPEAISAKNLTAVIYAFSQVGNCATPYATDSNPALCQASGQYGTATGVQDYKLYSTDAYSDFKIIPKGYKKAGEKGLGNMAKVIQKMHALKKPVLLSIGGYTLTVPLKTAIDDTHRADFVASIVDFLGLAKSDNNGDGFDGVDVDWEPNDNQWTFLDTGEARQVLANYVAFLTELKQALHDRYVNYAWLTIATPASAETIAKAEQLYPGFWQKVAEQVNYMNVMAYDYHGAFDDPKQANFLAPLHADPQEPQGTTGHAIFNIDSTVQAYLAAGIPAQKLVLGAPAYGRAVSNVSGTSNGLYQTFTGAYKGQYDQSGVYDYSYIIKNFSKDKGCVVTPYEVVNETAAYCPSEKMWISYDSVSDVRAKASYIQQMGLGGIMFWSLSGDARDDKDSLVKAASDQFNCREGRTC